MTAYHIVLTDISLKLSRAKVGFPHSLYLDLFIINAKCIGAHMEIFYSYTLCLVFKGNIEITYQLFV
jgi:hypothetical protein